MIEHFPLTEFGGGNEIRGVTFSPDGKFFVSGDKETIRVWRVNDDKWQLAKMLEASGVLCLSVAVSRDSKWIAAGTAWGWVFIWNATTFEKVAEYTVDSYWGNNGVDFSPDSTRVVSASDNRTATVWDRTTGDQLQTFRHDGYVTAAKYSSRGNRIATATENCIRVWDGEDDTLLVDVNVVVTPWRNSGGLLWFNDHLFAVSDSKIKQLDASTGSVVSEWPVQDTNKFSSIAIPKHGKFIACSTSDNITFWDTSEAHSRLGLIQLPQDARSIAFSPDDKLLAIGGENGKINIQELSHSHELGPVSLSRLHPTFQEPDIQVEEAVLTLWKNNQSADAEALLTSTIDKSQDPNHHALAIRALVRARLEHWNEALVDAEMSIDAQPSVLGYIAKSLAHVGNGEKDKAYRACDIAFERFHSSHVTFLLLTKAVIVFMAGEHRDAISRIDDLIATVHHNSICYVVQAYMYLLLGNLQSERNYYKGAIESFERAESRLRPHTSRPLSMVSLIFGWRLEGLGITIQRRLSDVLTRVHKGRRGWAHHVRQLERLGDTAAESQQHDKAVSHYSAALSFDHPSPQRILIKRSKAYIATGSWKQALDDANQVITLDPSSPWGHEMKYAALHKGGDYENAIKAYEAMLSRMQESPDPETQRLHDQYIDPSSIRATIHKLLQKITPHLPCELINTTTGRLHDRTAQEFSFKSSRVFHELVSSMTRRIDYGRIKHEIRQYFRYVVLSHRWEENEPLYEDVVRITVYELNDSPTHDKLQTFCELVRDGGFGWAWSDTVCINKSDHFVLQEALVAMFKWYRGSAMVIVYLRGVRTLSPRGSLVKSVWNTRAWTLQEYVAGKVIYFYTEDWTPYLDLKLANHKESPIIVAEMEEATGVSARQLMALRPGLSNIREKLRLASDRQTTLVEDSAYSLLGIFSVSGIPAIYGEGEAALGRLLAHVLAGSGDVSVLAWTGESGSFNSCLPADIAVFGGPATSHFPPPIPDAEMERITAATRNSSFDLDTALKLYDRLNELPAPWFAASRMKLPCIAFELPTPTLHSASRSTRLYHAYSVTFGMIEIKTRQNLSRMKPLYLVHPWLDAILDREHTHHSVPADDTAPPYSPTDEEGIFDEDLDEDPLLLPESERPSPQLAPLPMAPIDKETRARRLASRLGQPFGALLVTLTSTGRRAMDYKRVAADSLITVRFQNVSLEEILDNVRTLDVL